MQATLEFDELQAFVNVVRCGSFTQAAEILTTQKAHLSRVVTRLEARLGVRLLQRSTRSLAVTEAGRELYERASTILAALEDTRNALERVQAEPQGLLRLTCGEEFGTLVVMRWVSRFLALHAQVHVQAELTNRVVDIVHEGFDLAIRVGPLADSALSARRLGEITYGFYASPVYLHGRPAPASPNDLAQHELIVFGGAPTSWLLRSGGEAVRIKPKARVLANNNLAVRHCAAQGLGIALLPVFQAVPLVEQGSLQPVLAGWSRPPVPVHVVFASSRYLSPKVRAFIDFASAQFADMLFEPGTSLAVGAS